MDLIDRQQAIDKFDPWLKVKGYSEGELNVLKAVLYELRVMPPVQPERPKGKWSDGYRWQRCSLCKQTGRKSWNYCPTCGADMRGEQE